MLAFKSILISRATVTNFHKLGGLQQRKFILTVLKGTSLKSVCQQSHVSAEGFKRYTALPLLASGDSRQSLAFFAL